MITTEQFNLSAKLLNMEVALIKAVAQVESNASGFLESGEPVILFEPHIFWQQLKLRRINPEDYIKGNEDILYKEQGKYPYGTVAMQHSRLDRATKINREAALCSASWGKFQIMGYHWPDCGCKSLQEFINSMYRTEDLHLQLFCNYLIRTGLDSLLRLKRFRDFARLYNGRKYVENYSKKLEAAYKRSKYH